MTTLEECLSSTFYKVSFAFFLVDLVTLLGNLLSSVSEKDQPSYVFERDPPSSVFERDPPSSFCERDPPSSACESVSPFVVFTR